jgi:hypothetical protein
MDGGRSWAAYHSGRPIAAISHARQMCKNHRHLLGPKRPSGKDSLLRKGDANFSRPSLVINQTPCIPSNSSICKIPVIGISNHHSGIFLDPTMNQLFPVQPLGIITCNPRLLFNAITILGGGRSRGRITTARHVHTGAGKVGFACCGVLGVVVGDGRLDSVLGKHGAVKLDRRQAQLLGDLGVLDLAGLLQCHAAYQFGQVAGAGNGGAAAEGLELDVGDGVVVGVDADLQLHDVAASGSSDQAGTDIDIALGHGADIARAAVVVEDFLVVRPPLLKGGICDGLDDLAGGDARRGCGDGTASRGGDCPGEHVCVNVVWGGCALACKRDIRGRSAEFGQSGIRIGILVDGRIDVDA